MLQFAAWSAATFAIVNVSPTHAQPPTRPALTQLAQDVQTLYRDAEAGTVRVRVPVPMLADVRNADHPLNKWDEHLDPDIRQRLRDNRIEGPVRIRVERMPQTQPATNPAATRSATTGAIDLDQAIRFDLMAPELPFNEHVGLVLDDKGYVLVHCYVDPRSLRDRPIRVTSGGKTVEATIVGSDRQTRLTVLRLAEPLGKPLPRTGSEPKPGTLVMMLTGARQGAVLMLWTGATHEHGLVINVDGAVAGFSHGGQLLSEKSFRPIVEQLIQNGVVKRAKLGTVIDAVAADDPLRHKVPALGSRPAIRVARVIPNSAAQAGGLRDNDIILSLAGEPVTDVFAFAATIAHCRGDTELKVMRGGKELTVTVNLQPE